MKADWLVKFLLLVIAVSVAGIAVRPYVAPPVAQAQASDGLPFYVEPGTSMLRSPDGSRQVLGKVMIDLRNGNIWGFPTLSQDPYPAAGAETKAPTSHPFLLGKFALADTER